MFLRTWSYEILALAVTVGIGASMIGLLIRFDGQPVFEWNNITLNTIISILSAVLKASILFAAAECIGQWKWIMLLRSKRSLLDFERVDLASRGPLGCVSLAWRRETPFILRLGLVIVILTVVVDPFSQQLLQLQQGIEYHDYLKNGEDRVSSDGMYAKSHRATTYYGGQQIEFNANTTSLDREQRTPMDTELRDTQLDFAMEAAILNGFALSTDAIKQQSPTSCPTGNCTWDKFPTLGVCHRCTDVTSELEKVEDFGDFFGTIWGDDDREDARLDAKHATAFALPNGHFLPNVNGCTGGFADCLPEYPEYNSGRFIRPYALTTYSAGNSNKTVSMQDIDTLIRSMSVIYMDGEKMARVKAEGVQPGDDRLVWPDTPVTAKECAVYFCMKEIEIGMPGDQLIENATEAESSRRVYPDPEKAQRLISDGTPYTLEYEKNTTYKQLDDSPTWNGNYSDLFLNYTDPDGVDHTAEMSYISYTSITQFLKEITSAKWENETKILDRVRKRIPNITELFNGAIAGDNMVGIKPKALTGLWSDYAVDIENKFEGLATSMTNEFRSKGQRGRYDSDFTSIVRGRIGTPVTAYRVAWYWLSLHGSIILGCAAFCFATMILSRDVPVWKSHSLATMSQAPTVIDFGSDIKNLGELEKRANTIEVSLSKKGDDGLLRQREGRSWSSE